MIVVADVSPRHCIPKGKTPSNVRYIGALSARGKFWNGNSCGLPIDNGIILSSGHISNAIGPNDDDGSSRTGGLGAEGDTDLGKLVGNGPTLDATLLEFDVFSTNSPILAFQYVFASEEYPEWIGQYNDPMAIFASTNRVGTQWIHEPLNNIALVPCTTNVLVGVGTVNGGDAGGEPTPTNPQFYLDNHDPYYPAEAPYAMDVPVFNVQYDGMTVLLTAQTFVTANVTTRLKIGVADYAGPEGNDRIWDSSVFLKSWSVVPSQ
jgi:hypothetical protein